MPCPFLNSLDKPSVSVYWCRLQMRAVSAGGLSFSVGESIDLWAQSHHECSWWGWERSWVKYPGSVAMFLPPEKERSLAFISLPQFLSLTVLLLHVSCCESRSEWRRDDRKTTPGTWLWEGMRVTQRRIEQTLHYRTEHGLPIDLFALLLLLMKSGFRWIGFCSAE